MSDAPLPEPDAPLPPRSVLLWSIPAAAIFLTRVPLGGWPYRPAEWHWCTAHFPLIGAAVGLFTGAVFALLLPIGAWPAALMAIGFSMILTGCFHEDGLADTADALGGGYTPEKVFEILKDSRVGSFGAAALVVSITARAALLASLGTQAPWLMALVGAGARLPPVWQLALLPYATPQASRSRDVARCRPLQAWVATGWWLLVGLAVAAGVGLHPGRIAAMVAAMLLLGLLLAHVYRRRVGGVTGDFLGATEQAGEIALLAVLTYQLP